MNQKQEIPKQMKKKQERKERYLVDTSVVAQKKLVRILRKKKSCEVFVPNTVIAELENLANRGNDAGFAGLEEIAKLHRLKPRIKIKFVGPRPSEHQIKYAKSGEIDALIRSLARKYNATLITADIVQWKSALAYGMRVYFVKTKKPKPKRRFFFKLK